MGGIAAVTPGGLLVSLQENLFDLAYIDDTTQTESAGLLALGGAPLAESASFKIWGGTLKDGFDACMEELFPFDWGKSPEDCVDGLHPTFMMFNVSNPDTWGNGNLLEVQEVGPFVALKDTQKVEADEAYWDQTGKARFRIKDTYTNSRKCDQVCDEFATSNTLLTLNIWYGLYGMLGMADGWQVAHAVAALDNTNFPATLKAYLDSTAEIPMDPHSALPLPTKVAARMVDFTTFLATPDAPKLGTIDLKQNLGTSEYASLRSFLWDLGGTLLQNEAPKFGVPARVTPILIKTNPAAVLGWGEIPAFVDPISSAAFTFNFVSGASGYETLWGAVPEAYIEEKMSSAFYHEGLGYVTQHYEMFGQPSTNNQSCAWDPDCAPGCYPTDNCKPLAAAGYDGGKIPGMYFGSPKGTPITAFPQFENFVPTFYLVVSMKSLGHIVLPAKYKGPDAPEDVWHFQGFIKHSAFKAATFTRRVENCGGAVTLESGAKDSPGIDCGFVKDTSPLMPYFGLPVYWIVAIRDFSAPGWEPDVVNANDGNSITIQTQVKKGSCAGNKFCTDAFFDAKGPAFTNFLHYGYEPHLGALIDVSLCGGLAWKFTPSPRHADLHTAQGYNLMPLFWVWNYLHLPGAVNMVLSQLQGVPAAFNGLYIFLITQCAVSLIGGFACCFCGV